MDLIGLTDEIILKLQLKSINNYLLEGARKVEVKKADYDLNRLLHFKRLDEKIAEFVDIFIKSFTEDQAQAMLKNLETLKIVEKKCDLPTTCYQISLGVYDAVENCITINYYRDKRVDKDAEVSTIFHELLHMASTKRLDDRIVTGFEIPECLGLSLNEGYTEYLTQKYFTKKEKYVYSDNMDLFFAKGIENIVGEEKMQEFFFTANLEGLVQELSKYAKRNDVIKLLYLMDKQHKLLSSSKEKNRIIEAIAKMNEKKLRLDYKSGKISHEMYQIEHAKKVEEYRSRVLWSEETTPIIDKGVFILYDQGYSSGVYELFSYNTPKEKQKEKQKKEE